MPVTNFYRDTFSGSSGTALTAHAVDTTPASGGGYHLAYGGGSAPTLNGTGLNVSTTGGYLMFDVTGLTVPSANYTVEAAFTVAGTPASGFFIGGRVSPAGGAFSGYAFGWWGAYGDYRLIRFDSGAPTFLASAAGTPGAGANVWKLDLSGSTIKAYVNGTLVCTAPGGDTTYGLAGTIGTITYPNGSGDIVVTDFKAYTGGGGVAAGTPSIVGKSNTTCSLVTTAATGGTSPYSYQWYRSTANGFTPGGGNLISGATGLQLNDTGLSANQTYYYVCRVTDSTSGTPGTADTTQLTVATNNDTEFAPNHANIVRSPSNWNASSGEVLTNCWGAYQRMTFGNTTKIGLVFNNATFGTANAPLLAFSIDGDPWETLQLGPSVYSPTLRSGLSTGVQHTLRFYYKFHDDAAHSFTDDYWIGPAVRVGVQKVVGSNGATLDTTAKKTRKVAVVGDSIVRGWYSTGFTTGDAWKAFAAFLGAAFDAEWGQIPGAGAGFIVAGGNGWPVLSSSILHHSAGVTRSFSDFGADDIIFICDGTNDHAQSDAAVTAAVTAIGATVRADAALPWVFFVTPFSGSKASAIAAATMADAKMQVLQIDAALMYGVPPAGTVSTPTAGTVDGTHPVEWIHSVAAAAIAQLAQAAIGAGSGGVGGGIVATCF